MDVYNSNNKYHKNLLIFLESFCFFKVTTALLVGNNSSNVKDLDMLKYKISLIFYKEITDYLRCIRIYESIWIYII